MAVFAPLTFLEDTTGRLFREFAVTVAAALLISGFVALTLSPALGARVIRRAPAEHGVKARLAAALRALSNGYERWLSPALARPGRVVLGAALWVALGVLLYQAIDEVVGQVLARVDADEGTDLLVVSDHGFGSTKAWINVNRWLQEQGWLRLKPGAALRKRLFYEAMKINDAPLVKRLLPESLGRAVRGRIRGGRSTFKTDLDQCIDWTQTPAFFASIPAQGIYINVKQGGIGADCFGVTGEAEGFSRRV